LLLKIIKFIKNNSLDNSIQLLESNRIVDFNFRNRIVKTFDSIRFFELNSIFRIDAINLNRIKFKLIALKVSTRYLRIANIREK